jgi:signal transduction histidine kinase
MTRRTLWQLAVAAALLVLLATLATVQYRWLGDVSQAERERLRVGLRTRATEFAGDIDREVATLFGIFRVDSDALNRDPAATLSDAYTRAVREASAAPLIKTVYLVAISSGHDWHMQRLNVDRRALEPADPSVVLPLMHRDAPGETKAAHPIVLADTIDPSTPALIVGIPVVSTVGDLRRFSMLPDPEALLRLVIVVFDENALRTQLVEPLVSVHFGPGEPLDTNAVRGGRLVDKSSEYTVTIVRRTSAAEVVYSSDPGAPIDERSADVAVPVFTLRSDVDRMAATALDSAAARGRTGLSVTIVRRGVGPSGMNVIAANDAAGAWQLLVRGKAGSLDALVARSRRRNLAISLGILGLLAGSFVLIIASAQRQHRLARQQMEFVASVSHELRTPLAVICSAGENLADGVVADREQVKTYGALVQSEGRRLADMVERVMEFAGIASGAKRSQGEVDLTRVLTDAIAAVELDARHRGIDLRVRTGAQLPPFVGDAEALRSAFQNVVANAVKYSRPGGAIDVDLAADEFAIRLRVADHGIGIDRDELAKIFKPFFRGRRALDAQVRGTGVGLSVVRHVVDAHGGTIRVESEPGAGTTVTIVLQKHDVRRLVAREAHQVS